MTLKHFQLYRWCDVIIIIAIYIIFVIVFASAKDLTGQWKSSPFYDWFARAVNGNSIVCCSTSDGHPISNIDWWLSKEHYYVRLDNQVYQIEPKQLVTEKNPTGHAVVWYRIINGKIDRNGNHEPPKKQILCFAPGALS